jgi:hypothetical protein
MNLPSSKPAIPARAKSLESDRGDPHVFEEMPAGGDTCRICRRDRRHEIHPKLDSADSPRWGF